ncbi:MAG: nucleotide exchange factor GrpE [Saccharofermentanales bacterium]|jgi:molecular chaperone GrpE
MSERQGEAKAKEKKNRLTEEEVVEETTVELPETEEVEKEETEQDKYDELNRRYLRVCADFDNYRRRTRQDQAISYEEGVMETVRALMPVIDSIDSAIKGSSQWETDEAREITEGIVLIGQQLSEAFRKLGVEEIEGVGSQFDPNVHEVVLHTEEEDQPENTVTEVFRKGYKKGDRVIRHSMVKVVN